MENNSNAYHARVLVSRISLEAGVAKYLTAMAEKIPFAYMHSVDVAYLAGEVGYELELDYVEDIVRGALLHDIGKMAMPVDLLTASRKLTPAEKAILRQHSEIGYEMIADADFLSEISKDIIRYHHEKQDGSGYPDNLTAKELKKGTKIVTVCDIYDAMTRPREWRKSFNAYEALNMMIEMPIDRSILKVLKECPDR